MNSSEFAKNEVKRIIYLSEIPLSMAWKDKSHYSKIIAVSAISLMIITLLFSVLIPIILVKVDQSLGATVWFIQQKVLIPLTSAALILALINMWIEFAKKKILNRTYFLFVTSLVFFSSFFIASSSCALFFVPVHTSLPLLNKRKVAFGSSSL